MKKLFVASLLLCASSLFGASSLPPHESVQQLKQELGIKVVDSQDKIPETATRLFLIHHGSTEWSETKRLQGWNQVPLSENGKTQMSSLAEKIKDLGITSIYSSSLQSSVESAEILKQRLTLPVIAMDELKGEFHGKFDGLTRSEYLKQPHFQLYYFLPAEEKLFFPCGKEGESKADVAKRVMPTLKQIAKEHPGESVAVILHGGVFKFLNFYAGKFKPEETISVGYGEFLEVAADENTIYIVKANP